MPVCVCTQTLLGTCLTFFSFANQKGTKNICLFLQVRLQLKTIYLTFFVLFLLGIFFSFSFLLYFLFDISLGALQSLINPLP